jgi:hypothetical protein
MKKHPPKANEHDPNWLSNWAKTLEQVAERGRETEQEQLSAIKRSKEWPEILRVAAYLRAEEVIALRLAKSRSEELTERLMSRFATSADNVPFESLKPGMQWRLVMDAMRLMESHDKVERALGRMVDKEAVKVWRVRSPILGKDAFIGRGA